jgi:hypothetical protein
MKILGSRNLMAKTTSYGRLFILEGYIPTIRRNKKEVDDHGGRRM